MSRISCFRGLAQLCLEDAAVHSLPELELKKHEAWCGLDIVMVV